MGQVPQLAMSLEGVARHESAEEGCDGFGCEHPYLEV